MDNIAGTKSSLTWAVNITVAIPKNAAGRRRLQACSPNAQIEACPSTE